MNDEFQFGNVESSGCQVGGNNQGVGAVPKFNQRPFPVHLFHAAKETTVINALVGQVVTNLLDGFLEVAEDDSGLIAKVVQCFDQGCQLVFGGRNDRFYL